jgi:hypothetical protein
MAEHLLRIAKRYGPYRFTSTCRTHAEQAKLYDDYLHGKNAFPVLPPGLSAHERGMAVDIARPDIEPHSDLFLHVLGASWREADPSLVWSESDPIHFEWRPN